VPLNISPYARAKKPEGIRTSVNQSAEATTETKLAWDLIRGSPHSEPKPQGCAGLNSKAGAELATNSIFTSQHLSQKRIKDFHETQNSAPRHARSAYFLGTADY
jgi:hypothetical protein